MSIDEQKQAAGELRGVVGRVRHGRRARDRAAPRSTRSAPSARASTSGELREVLGIPTSRASEAEAIVRNVPLTTLAEHPVVDLTIDGADEVDAVARPDQGRRRRAAGARRWWRRRACARSSSSTTRSRRRSSARRCALPVEVAQFGWRPEAEYLDDMGATVTVRRGADGAEFVTDEGNWILDCAFGPIADPARLAGLPRPPGRHRGARAVPRARDRPARRGPDGRRAPHRARRDATGPTRSGWCGTARPSGRATRQHTGRTDLPLTDDGRRDAAALYQPLDRQRVRGRVHQPAAPGARHGAPRGLRRRRGARRPARVGLRRVRGPDDRRDPRRDPGLERVDGRDRRRRVDRRRRGAGPAGARPGRRRRRAGRALRPRARAADPHRVRARARPGARARCSVSTRVRSACSATSTTTASSAAGTGRP